jgi:hypothetical protein
MPSTTLFTQAFAPYLALGIGELGAAAAALGRQEGLADELPWAACDFEPARLIATGLRRKLLVENLPESSSEAVQAFWAERQDELRALAAKRTVAVLFGDLNDPAAAALAPGLARALRSQGLHVCVIGMANEGCEANDVAADLEDAAELVFRIPKNTLPPQAGPATGLMREPGAAARELLRAVHAHLGACAGGVAFDELKSALRGAGPIHAVAGSGEGSDAPFEALEHALRSVQASGGMPADARIAVAVTSGREMTLTEYRRLRERLSGAAPAGEAALLGIGCDGAMGEEAHALVLWRLPHSPNVLRFPKP